MYAVIGVLLVALGIVSFQFAYIQHNRPVPAPWTEPELSSQLFSVILLSVMVAGFGSIVHFLLFSGLAALTPLDIGLVVAIVAVTALLMSVQGRHWGRLQAAAQTAVAGLQSSNDDSDPGRPPSSGVAGRRRRRAA